MLPFELFVYATPVSTQTRRKQKRSDWRDVIADSARARGADAASVVAERVRVRIGYYYRGPALDVDNIVKAILDGLKGVVYTDDGLVMDLIVSKRSLDEEATLPATPDFVRAVAEGADFVHIVVDRSEAIEVFRLRRQSSRGSNSMRSRTHIAPRGTSSTSTQRRTTFRLFSRLSSLT